MCSESCPPAFLLFCSCHLLPFCTFKSSNHFPSGFSIGGRGVKPQRLLELLQRSGDIILPKQDVAHRNVLLGVIGAQLVGLGDVQMRSIPSLHSKVGIAKPK